MKTSCIVKEMAKGIGRDVWVGVKFAILISAMIGVTFALGWFMMVWLPTVEVPAILNVVAAIVVGAFVVLGVAILAFYLFLYFSWRYEKAVEACI